MLNGRKKMFLLVTTLFFIGCSLPEYESNGDLVYTGPLDAQFQNSFRKWLEVREISSKVILTTPGGSMPVAHRLVTALNRFDIPLEIKGLCLSACSQYVVLAADDVAIIPGTVFGFHVGPFYHSTVLNGAEIEGTATAEILDQVANDEKGALDSRGVDISLLQRAGAAMEPECYVVSGEGVYVKARYQMGFFSRSELAQFGYPTEYIHNMEFNRTRILQGISEIGLKADNVVFLRSTEQYSLNSQPNLPECLRPE